MGTEAQEMLETDIHNPLILHCLVTFTAPVPTSVSMTTLTLGHVCLQMSPMIPNPNKPNCGQALRQTF